MQINSFDDLAQDKDRSLFGKTTAMKFQRIKVMIIGLESLGAEVAKNIIQLQPEVLTICDPNIATVQDLDHNLSVHQDHLGKMSRAQTCEKMLNDQFTSQTSVMIFDFNINSYFETVRKHGNKQLPEQLLLQLDKHDLIIVADILSRSFVVEISRRLRDNCQNATNKKFNQGVIWCGTIGLHSYLYEDYGPTFKVFDKDGQQAFPYGIESISKSDPGIVRVLKDKPHNFVTGDFVCIQDVEGMAEVNGNCPRPIRVISPHEFSIEDTSQLSNYQKGGLVYLAKVPFRVKFNSLEEQIALPQFDKVPYYKQNTVVITRAITGHVALLSISKVLESNDQIFNESDILVQAEENFDSIRQKLKDLRQQNIESMQMKQSNTITLSFTLQNNQVFDWDEIKFDKQLCLLIIKDFRYKLYPFVTFMGGIIALECVKFSGKYTPQYQGPLCIEQYSQFNLGSQEQPEKTQRFSSQTHIFGKELQDRLTRLSILLVGMGGNGCEFLRVLTMMGVASHPEAKITLVDDDLVHRFNLRSHYWFSQDTLNKPKTQVAQSRAWRINQNINIDVLPIKISGKEEMPKDFDWATYNLIVSSISQGRQYICQMSSEQKIPLLDQSLNNVKLTTQVIKSGQVFENLVENETLQVFDFSRDTYLNFPYLPMHSLVWAKEQFHQHFIAFVTDFEHLTKDPKAFIHNIKPKLINHEGQVALLLVLGKMVLEQHQIDLGNFITLAKELFEFQFTVKIRRFLAKYPPDLKVGGEYFWVGYKKAPQQIHFDINNETHVQFVQITAFLFASIFSLRCEEAFDVIYVKNVLQTAYREQRSHWNLSREYNDKHVEQMLHKLENCQLAPIKTKTINFEDDSVRNLYVEMIFLLTNLRSKVYSIQPMPKYKVQKYALDINKSNPMMHSILIYKLMLTDARLQNMLVDMNRNEMTFQDV